MGSTARQSLREIEPVRVPRCEKRRERGRRGGRGEERRGSNVNKNKRNTGASANPSKAPSHCPRPPALLEKWLIRLLWCSSYTSVRERGFCLEWKKKRAGGKWNKRVYTYTRAPVRLRTNTYTHTHTSPQSLVTIPTVILIPFISVLGPARFRIARQRARDAATPAFSAVSLPFFFFLLFSFLALLHTRVKARRNISDIARTSAPG